MKTSMRACAPGAPPVSGASTQVAAGGREPRAERAHASPARWCESRRAREPGAAPASHCRRDRVHDRGRRQRREGDLAPLADLGRASRAARAPSPTSGRSALGSVSWTDDVMAVGDQVGGDRAADVAAAR